jgi:hypothetical protein
MVRILPISIPAAVLGSLLRLDAAPPMVLPLPRAEIFAPARAHVGDSFAVSMPAPFIRSWLWEPVTGAGTAFRFDPGVNPMVVSATAIGTLQVTGTVEDQARASDTGSARVEVVQGDFANPGGVLAAWGPATASRLPSGRVLVVAGRASGLFDPLTNTWRPSAPLLADHGEGHTETLLEDGTVLVTGGSDRGGASLRSAERYDPVGNSWAPAARPTVPRAAQRHPAGPGRLGAGRRRL